MVTIWPSFISCLITSEALMDILCARSATEMVSGTCTSCTTCSAGATKAVVTLPRRSALRSAPRRPAGPLRPGERQAEDGRAPPGAAAPLGLAPRVLASSAQLEDSFSDLADFL